ncbi:1-acyl-sn-glycerol-3-phosphate acyltransferase gamma [Patella vulgata]|uniref:1-acyl-sn-glycerol-3-phosphate acyltransferase gamma n=1 Tax=Patella vulgata TaxID=6465 RepID=UPI00218029F9|nr:1-acyl-sn-glycerol-3-phosphate acyltransferase gamma [Patella vulgata]
MTMTLGQQIKTWFILHLLMGYVFVASGLIVCFLMLCACIVWPFNKHLYRKIIVHLAYAHWSLFISLGEWWSGSECLLYTSPEVLKMVGKEHILVVMNHKYDIDWLMTWLLAERFGMLGNCKIYGKEMLKYVPLIGWAWYFNESIFLKRNWESDKKTIENDLKKLTDYPDGYWVTCLLFPEGTRFTEDKHKASLEVSRSRGYPDMKHHLLPRPKGFILSIQNMKGKIPAVYDLTIAFPSDGPEPTLMNVIQGKSVTAHLLVRRFDLDKVPVDTDEEAAVWLRDLFQEKDEIFENFMQKQKFEGVPYKIPSRPYDLIITIFWFVLTCVPLFKYLGGIFLSGTILQQVICISVITIASVGVRWMIGVTEIARGSHYGTENNKNHKKVN